MSRRDSTVIDLGVESLAQDRATSTAYKYESRWAPGALWRRVSDLTAPLVYRVPHLAFALLCVKDLTRR